MHDPSTQRHRTRFRRYGCKYLIPEDLAAAVREYAAPYVEPDPHAARSADSSYDITSLYLDSHDFRLYRETEEGLLDRIKLREGLIENHLRGVTQHLDLDADQQAAIRSILERSAPALVEAQRRAGASQRRLSEVFAAPRFDADAFRRASRDAQAARTTVDSISSELLAAEAAVLTPEQRVLFAEVVPNMHRQAPQRPAGDRPPPGGVLPRPRDGERLPPR